MHYDDLSIEIWTLADGAHKARILASSQNFGEAPFELPIRPETLEKVLVALERRVWRSRLTSVKDRELGARDDEKEPGSPALPAPGRLGEDLYSALFHGAAARVLHEALGHAEGRSQDGDAAAERGLRVRFVFDLAEAERAELAIVPWELLRRADRREYLARCLHTPVVRRIAVPRPARSLRVTGRLRVLLAEASPDDQTALETALEARLVREALEQLPEIEVTHLERVDLKTLSDRLRWGGFHVLHFMGHGDFDEATETVLCLDDGRGVTRKVDPWTFADNVKRSTSLRLVVLNACETAKLPRQRGQDPYSAAAAALALAGVPAIVAMQFPISDRAAVVFATAFYESLAHREPLEAAVVDGRLAICGERDCGGGETLEWVTPVLYLQAENGIMLEAQPEESAGGAAAPAARSPQPTVPDASRAARPLRLGIRSLVGLGHDLEAKADRTLSLVEYFDGRRIRDDALWHEAVLPSLRDFLTEGVSTGRPLILDLAAHQSLAFAAGSFLEAKSGVEISVIQRGLKGTYEWPAMPGAVSEGPFWQEPESIPRDETAPDVAVAISATWDILNRDVVPFVDGSRLEVHRILHVALPEPGPAAVRDGAHALRLAHILGRTIRARTPEERQGTVHLFAAAPNGLLVFLGQIAPALGPVQLYEYDFPQGPYCPSFRLPA
jgi:hypothetical protein